MDLEVDIDDQKEMSTHEKSQQLDDSEDPNLANILISECDVNLVENNRINLINLTPMYPEIKSDHLNTHDPDPSLYSIREQGQVKDELNLEGGSKLVEELNEFKESINSENKGKLDEGSVELPEGWVRCGKGLRMDFPNTPKNPLNADNLESKNLFINFTDGRSKIRSQKSLQSALMSIDRTAVRELRGGLVAIKASKVSPSSENVNNQSNNKIDLHTSHIGNNVGSNYNSHHHISQSQCRDCNTNIHSSFYERVNKLDLNKCNYPYGNRTNLLNRRCNTGTKVNTSNLTNLETSRRNNTHSAGLTDLETLRAQHKKEMEQMKQSLLSHFRDLVEKYRELAIDAVNAARNEQKKCQEECKQAYSTAYNACLKYEKDLKNTIRFALKEYQHNSNKEPYESFIHDKDSFLKKIQSVNKNKKDFNLTSHKMLRQDLSHDYQIDETSLMNFEPKVVERFNNFVNQLSLFLEENYGLTHKDSTEFVKSVISNTL